MHLNVVYLRNHASLIAFVHCIISLKKTTDCIWIALTIWIALHCNKIWIALKTICIKLDSHYCTDHLDCIALQQNLDCIEDHLYQIRLSLLYWPSGLHCSPSKHCKCEFKQQYIWRTKQSKQHEGVNIKQDNWALICTLSSHLQIINTF